jgi:hypothetical protein
LHNGRKISEDAAFSGAGVAAESTGRVFKTEEAMVQVWIIDAVARHARDRRQLIKFFTILSRGIRYQVELTDP